MSWQTLPFTAEDIALIRRGLDAREAGLRGATLVASNHMQ